jgi:hypothetical protein
MATSARFRLAAFGSVLAKYWRRAFGGSQVASFPSLIRRSFTTGHLRDHILGPVLAPKQWELHFWVVEHAVAAARPHDAPQVLRPEWHSEVIAPGFPCWIDHNAPQRGDAPGVLYWHSEIRRDGIAFHIDVARAPERQERGIQVTLARSAARQLRRERFPFEDAAMAKNELAYRYLVGPTGVSSVCGQLGALFHKAPAGVDVAGDDHLNPRRKFYLDYVQKLPIMSIRK